MEKEEETREILLPNWQGSGSHGITIDQTDDGVFVKRVQQNSPAAKMGVVKEGDQIVSATVYFDNLQSGEVAQLLNSMGHHTVGLRLQRKGDRSPLAGQGWGHDVFAASSPEVVLSGDDEEYRRIYTTKIKPRLKPEEVAAEGEGLHSRTITVTRKVTAYTVDVGRHGGAKDVDAVGPDFTIRIPTRGVPQIPATDWATEPGGGAEGTGRHAATGAAPLGPTGDTSPPRLAAPPRSEAPCGSVAPGAQMDPTGPTGGSIAVERPGRVVPGAVTLGAAGSSPRIEANGQMGNLEGGWGSQDARWDAKGHGGPGEWLGGSSPPHVTAAPALHGGTKGAGADVSAPVMDSPTVDVGKIKIPVLKMPKFGVPTAGPAVPAPHAAAPAAQLAGPEISAPSTEPAMPQVDVGLKGTTKVPSPAPEPHGLVGGKGANVELVAPGAAVPGGKVQIPRMNVPKFTARDGGGAAAEGALPKGDGGPGGPEVAIQGDWQGPKFKMVERPQISLADISLRGPQVKGEVGVTGPTVDGGVPGLGSKGLQVGVKAPDVAFEGPEGRLKGPSIPTPDMDVRLKGPQLKGEGDLSTPKLGGDLKGPQLDLKGPKLGMDAPDVHIKGPRVTMPEMHIKAPKISMPDVDFNLKGPKVKGDVDVSVPKLEGDLKGPEVDIKGPKVDVDLPDVELEGPEGKLKGPKFKMPEMHIKAPKFSMPDVDFNLKGPKLKGDVDMSLPGAECELKGPTVDIDAPKVEIGAPDVDLDGAEGKFKLPKFKMPKFSMPGFKGEGVDVDVTLPRGDVAISGPGVEVEVPDMNVEGKVKGPKLTMPEMHLKAPKVSIPDVDFSIKGPQLKGDVDVSGPRLEGDLKAPKIDIEAPDVTIEGPEGKLKGPKFKMPEMHIKAPKISMPDVDFNLKGPKVKGDVDVSVPKLEGDLKGPEVDIKGPRVDVDLPDVELEGPEGKLKGPKFKMPEMHIKAPQISMPDIDLNLKGPKLKGDVDLQAPKLEGGLKGPEVDIKGPKVDIEGPEVDVNGLEGKVKMPKMKLPKFGFKGEGPEVDVDLPKAEAGLAGPKVDISGPEVSVEGLEGKVKGPKLKVPDMHVTVPHISMPEIDLNLKGHKTKGGFDLSTPKAEGHLKGPEVDIKGPDLGIKSPEVDVECPDVSIEGPEANIKFPKFKKSKFGFGMKSPKAEIEFPEAELTVESPDGSVGGKGKKSKFKMPKIHMGGPKMKGRKGGFDVSVAGAELDANWKSPELDASGAGPDVTIKGDATVKSPKGKKPMFGKISFPDVEFDLKSHRFRGDASAVVPKVEGELKVPDLEISVPSAKGEVKGPSLSVDVEAPDLSLKKPKFQLPGGQVGAGDLGMGGDLKGPSVAAPSISVPDVDFGVKGPRVKGGVNVPGAELEGPEGKVKLPQVGKGLEVPDVNVDVAVPAGEGSVTLDVKLQGPHVTAPDFKGKGPKLTGELGVGAEGPCGGLVAPSGDGGGWGGKLKVKGPALEAPALSMAGSGGGAVMEAKAPGATLSVGSAGGAVKGPSVAVGAPALDVNLQGPKLKGDLDVSAGAQPPRAASDAAFEILGGTIKLPSLKLPQFGLSSPGVNGGDGGVTLEGPQGRGGLTAVGGVGGLEGPDVEVKGPKFQAEVPDVELKLKGPNLRGAVDVKAPKVNAEAPGVAVDGSGAGVCLDAPALKVSTSGLNVNVKGPKIKGGVGSVSGEVGIGGGGLHVGGPTVGSGSVSGSQDPALGKVSFPRLRLPKFVFSEPEVKGREMGVDVDFPGGAAANGGGAEAEPEEAEARLKKSKLKMPKFHFPKARGKGGPEASGSVSGSRGSLGEAGGEVGGGAGGAEAPKAKFSLFKSKRPRPRAASFSDERVAPEPGGANAAKGKFGTFGGVGARAAGSYEVTGSDEEGGRALGSIGGAATTKPDADDGCAAPKERGRT